MSFHDDKLWQEAYVAAIDTLEATHSASSGQADGLDGDLVDQVRKHSMMVLTEVGQAVANRDRKVRDLKLHNVANIIIALRSLLSLLWAREGFDDATFGKLDASYEALANKLPH